MDDNGPEKQLRDCKNYVLYLLRWPHSNGLGDNSYGKGNWQCPPTIITAVWWKVKFGTSIAIDKSAPTILRKPECPDRLPCLDNLNSSAHSNNGTSTSPSLLASASINSVQKPVLAWLSSCSTTHCSSTWTARTNSRTSFDTFLSSANHNTTSLASPS